MIIGIDLGTTNSLAAFYGENGPELIPNRLGEKLTPSVVSTDKDGMIYVGRTAEERKITYPTMTADVFKRSMGTDKEFFLGNNKFRAEELSSLVLRSLKEDAEAYFGYEVRNAIISVPAYFNDVQRKAVKKAAELADLDVERIINEPTAAAIAYGIDQKKDNTRFLVFDLGGGTFDVSILELSDNIMEVRAIAGDNYIGGEDFTEILYRMFININKIDENELDMKTTGHIRRQAEKAKLSFSDGEKVVMRCKLGSEIIEQQISLDDYERGCQMLLEKMRKPIERSLRDANVKVEQIDEVVLVGGATKLSIVRSFVGKLFRRVPNTGIDPDEAVARGAALQCAMKERNEEIREIVLTDVCPFTLGTSIVLERMGKIKEGGHFLPIIERNTVIPVSKTDTLYTVYDNQKKLEVDILQGESRFAKNNLLLGEITVDIPGGPAGQESIDLTYTYDINSILEVIVKVNSTGEKKKLIIQKEGSALSEREAEERMEKLDHLKIHPRDLEENKLLIFRGERMYEEAIGDMRQEIDNLLSNFEYILDRQNKDEIRAARKELKEALDELEDLF